MKVNAAFVVVVLALVLLGAAAIPSYGQVLYGSIVGTVEDPSGAVVPKAAITVINKQTGTTRAAIADEGGRFTILNLLPGLYDVKAGSAGFRALTRADIEVTINTTTRADMKLEIGQTTEQVTVTAMGMQLQTDKSDLRHEIDGKTIQNLPLSGYRNYQSLIALIPGATPPQTQNSPVDTPGRALRSFVNGTATNNNNTLVDGAVNINIWLPHHVAYVQPVESIETVNISSGSFDAEQGMAGGAAITLATKSGTNTFHGTAWEFHNNQHLNSASTYFRSSSYVKPLYIRNIFGGNLGGPIKKDKLFFFFNYERTSERNGVFGNYSVAPADFRAGDFSAWTNYSIVYDPDSSTAAASRTPFPGNKIPANRINPVFPNIYKNMPLPNQISATDPLNLSGNYGISGALKLDRNQYDTKINYNLSRNLTTWGKYSRMDAPVDGKYPFGALGGAALGTEGTGNTTTQLVTAGYTYTFSPTMVMDGVFGYTRMDQAVTIPDLDKNVGLDVWKIPGTNGGKQYANDLRYGSAPTINGFGFDAIGYTQGWTPVWRHERSYTYQTNFSKILKAHEIRWGFEARRMELNHWQPETGNPRGAISFAGGITGIPGVTTRSPNSYASALLGLVSSYSKSIQFFEMKTREWQYAFYVRDRWQVSRRLTLNLGLRYEYYPLINRGDRGIERWDPATNIVYFGGLGNTPRDVGIEVSKKLFAPRVGFAYRAGENWVVRSAYGITYDPLPFGRPLRGLYPSTLTGSWIPTISTFGWFNALNEGIPDVPTPDVSKGFGTLPLSIDMGPRSPWGGMLHRGYIQSWNFTVERRLPFSMIGRAGYVGTRTIHQLIDRNINSVGPGGSVTTANLPLAKAYGKTIATNMWDGIGTANYHGLQSELEKRFTHGLLVRASYTFAKSLSMADEDGWTSLANWNWDPVVRRNYAPSGYDRTHMFTTGWNYEIPAGKGKKYVISNKVLDAVAGGWRVVGSFVAYSGTAFGVSGTGSSLQAAGNSQTGDQVAPVVKLGGKGPGDPYYDPFSFRDPQIFFAATGVYRFGSTGRNFLRGPGYWRLNPALFKNFKIKEKLNAEFRAESDNITNTRIWGNPSGSSASFRVNPDGTLNKSFADPLGNFMCITGASTGREFRFGLRVSF